MSSSGVSLLQIPEIPLKHVLKYLEFPSILVLRKVCHDLRSFIDDTKPSSYLTGIELDMDYQSINFNLRLPCQIFSIDIDYMKIGDGCLVKCEKEENVKEKILGNEDFVTVFFKDFDIVLRHQKTVLEEFKINFNYMDSTIDGKIMENANKSLKSMKKPLQVKYLYMVVNNHYQILSILPYIDPKPLELIHIAIPLGMGSVMLNLNKIGQLEQWKHANELSLHGFEVPDLSQNIKHFSRIVLELREVSTEELVLLKEIFLSSSTLITMEIYMFYVLGPGLIETFGEPFVDTNENRNWFFRIPDTIQFLRITPDSLDIHFNRIEQSDVPQNAKISN